MSSPLHQSRHHESGRRHASGEARYVDDLPSPRGLLHGHVLASPLARARIVSIDVAPALAVPGVRAVLTAADIPGHNSIGAIAHDEPLLADGEVFAVGQAIALVLADSLAAGRAGAAAVRLELEALPAVLSLDDAIAGGHEIGAPHRMQRGDVDAALETAALVLSGVVETGGQDHFYLETQASLATPGEDDTLHVASSTQHPSEVQAKVAEVLGLGRHRVVVETARMGGGFGGKETQAAPFAALAALGAWHTRQPVKLWLNRDQDMVMTGKRHPFRSRYRAGFASDGRLLGVDVEMWADAGWTQDLSLAILDRGLFHLDNAYHLPALRFVGRVARTNKASNTAFRGFGGPQGVAVIEAILDRAADRLGIDPAELRRRNYYGPAPRDRTPYDQPVPAPRLERIHGELCASSDYAARRAAIDAFNARSRWVKRGLALSPVKFGISFTHSVLNQAGALVQVYADGAVQLNHGGTEMGQGLHTKMLAICAHELGVPVESIRVMPTATDKVPNTSATAASSGSDLNGAAVKAACRTLIARLRPVAARRLGLDADAAERICFQAGRVSSPDTEASCTWAELCEAAWQAQVSLSATGYYATPDIHYDRAAGRGKPFHYFAYGAAVVETEVSGLTGEHRLRRVDILHDVGDSLVPSIDIGQIEGAFVQGYGWLSTEELVWSAAGELKTHSPDTYKIPALGDVPVDLRVQLLSEATEPSVVHGSKAVGEPPFMLALAAVGALRHAIRAFAGAPGHEVELSIPCTPEAVLRAVEAARGHAAASGEDDGRDGDPGLRSSGGAVREPPGTAGAG